MLYYWRKQLHREVETYRIWKTKKEEILFIAPQKIKATQTELPLFDVSLNQNREIYMLEHQAPLQYETEYLN